MKGDPKIPSLAAVNAAWVTARPGRPEAPATADEPRTDPFRARPFC